MRLLVLIVMLAIAHQPLCAQENLPGKVRQRVTDMTSTLSPGQVADLERKLEEFEQQTSNQIIVVLISTIGSGSLEEASLRIAEANGVGKKDRNNGVLLLVVKDDRLLRIEVGYGLEGVLTDALSGIIIRREITPHFRTGDYNAGIYAGVEAIMLATKDEYKGDGKSSGDEPGGLPLFLIVLILLFVFGRFGRRGILFLPGGFGGSRRAGGFGGFPKSGGGWGGGGGFRGGGGSFGGGGASGRW